MKLDIKIAKVMVKRAEGCAMAQGMQMGINRLGCFFLGLKCNGKISPGVCSCGLDFKDFDEKIGCLLRIMAEQ